MRTICCTLNHYISQQDFICQAVLLCGAATACGSHGCCKNGCHETCFPSTAQVNLENGNSMKMSELQVGDKVQVQKGMYL